MKYELAPAALALLLSVGCQQGPPPAPPQNRAAELEKINQLRDQFAAAYSSGEAEAVAALYTADAVVLPSNSPAAEGQQAILELYKRQLSQGPAKIRIASQETELAGDWAYDRGSVTITLTPKGAKGPVEIPARYLVILRRQPDGSWKVYRDIDNTSEPPAGAVEAAKR